ADGLDVEAVIGRRLRQTVQLGLTVEVHAPDLTGFELAGDRLLQLDEDESGLVVDSPIDQSAGRQRQVAEVDARRRTQLVCDFGKIGTRLIEGGHGQGLPARPQIMIPAADGESGVEYSADLRIAAFGAEFLVVVLVSGPGMDGELDDDGLPFDLDTGETTLVIGEFAGLSVVRQRPQARGLGIFAVLALALGGEDDRAVLAQRGLPDGLVAAGDAPGRLPADIGEVAEGRIALGVEERVL